MAIIAALSVQYSNLGIKIFQPFFLPCNNNSERSPELADTPPAIAILLMAVSLLACTNFFNSILTRFCCRLAQISGRFSCMKAGLVFTASRKKYKKAVLIPLNEKSSPGIEVSGNLKAVG